MLSHVHHAQQTYHYSMKDNSILSHDKPVNESLQLSKAVRDFIFKFIFDSKGVEFRVAVNDKKPFQYFKINRKDSGNFHQDQQHNEGEESQNQDETEDSQELEA